MITVSLIGFIRILPKLGLSDKRLAYLFIVSLSLYYTELTSNSSLFEVFQGYLHFVSTFPFLTKNRDILFLICWYNFCNATRRLFNKCLLREFEKKGNIITNNNYLKV